MKFDQEILLQCRPFCLIVNLWVFVPTRLRVPWGRKLITWWPSKLKWLGHSFGDSIKTSCQVCWQHSAVHCIWSSKPHNASYWTNPASPAELAAAVPPADGRWAWPSATGPARTVWAANGSAPAPASHGSVPAARSTSRNAASRDAARNAPARTAATRTAATRSAATRSATGRNATAGNATQWHATTKWPASPATHADATWNAATAGNAARWHAFAAGRAAARVASARRTTARADGLWRCPQSLGVHMPWLSEKLGQWKQICVE